MNAVGQATPAAFVCTHCGEEARHQAFGLCHPCYMYEWRTGRPRPLHHPTRCCVCQRPFGRHRNGGICRACYVRCHRAGLRAADIYAGGPRAVLRALSGRAS